MKLISICLLVLAASVGCQSTKKSPAVGATGGPGGAKAIVPVAPPIEIATVAKGAPALLARAITSVGENRAPRFSPDGAKLLFLSGARPSHKQNQVYEIDLSRMTERRVTFHDGDDEGASWAAGGKIVYSSITDEMKEDLSLDRLKAVYEASKATGTAPNGIRSLPKPAGGDIYMQRLDGRDIERLTSTPGPDVSPTANLAAAKSPKIVFVSSRDGDARLYMYEARGVKPLTRGTDAAPAFSPDGKFLAWERSLAPGQTQIVMSADLRTVLPLTSPGFNDRTPAWTAKADAVIFSSNRGGKTFDLYLIDRNAACLKRLTQTTVDLTSPSMSPDGSKIAFTSTASGQAQIYLMENRSAELPCLAIAAPVDRR